MPCDYAAIHVTRIWYATINEALLEIVYFAENHEHTHTIDKLFPEAVDSCKRTLVDVLHFLSQLFASV